MKNLLDNKFEKCKADFPILISQNFIDKKNCKKISNEIEKFKKFDDVVMNGRNRINKGSKNFKRFIARSKNAAKIFNILNNKKFYLDLITQFENNFKKLNLKKFKNYNFSKINYGLQSGKKLTKYNFRNLTCNLDMDFSVSEKGYVRGIHRDRVTRVVNFLIYLNKLPYKSGGDLEIFNLKNKKKLDRFQNKKNVRKVSTIKSLPGRTVFFLSSPNSYHAVSKITKNTKRFFIYGSFSLNKAVSWDNYVQKI